MMEHSFRSFLKLLWWITVGMNILLFLVTLNIPFLALLYLVFAGYYLNRTVFHFPPFDSTLLIPLTIGALISAASAPVLYFSRLTSLWIFGILAVPAAILIFFRKKKNYSKNATISQPPLTYILYGLSCALSAATVLVAFQSQTVLSTLGPWDAMNPLFFLLIFLNIGVLLAGAVLSKTYPFSIVCISAFFFSIVSVLAVVYPLGFGFDPHLHTAAEKIIFQEGAISPKTPYYNGHYGLMVILSKIFSQPLEFFDRFFVVGTAALALPLLIFRTLSPLAFGTQSALLSTILVLSLAPLSPISSQTPWGHAFFLALVAIIASVLSWNEKNKRYRWFLLLITAALFSIHPLAGLPMAGFIGATFFSRQRVAFSIFFLALSALAVPSAFFILSKISPQLPVTLQPFRLGAVIDFFTPFLPHWEWRFHALLDLAYLYAHTIDFLLLMGGITALFLMRKRSSGSKTIKNLFFIGFAGSALSAIITSGFIAFPSLPVYEQKIYTDRIKEIALLFLVVLACYSLAVCIRKISHSAKNFLFFFFILFFAGLGVANVYALYPRNDAYVPYHGNTVSQYDIESVQWIEQHGQGSDYVVLANQVSAAASIKEFGFKKYYTLQNKDSPYQAFYYSIPATSPLYQSFLTMLEEPSPEIAEEVMQAAGVNRVYFIVHKYEPRFRNVIDKAKKITGEWQTFGNEDVTVFVLKP